MNYDEIAKVMATAVRSGAPFVMVTFDDVGTLAIVTGERENREVEALIVIRALQDRVEVEDAPRDLGLPDTVAYVAYGEHGDTLARVIRDAEEFTQ